jgi:hypothetical protein
MKFVNVYVDYVKEEFIMVYSYEKNGNRRYLVAELESNDKVDSYAYNMVNTNKIHGILPMKFVNDRGHMCYKYDLGKKRSIAEINKKFSLNQTQMFKIFANIADILINIDEYMLTENCFVFDENYIFVDTESCDVEVVCSGLKQDRYFDYDIGSFLYSLRCSMNVPPLANQRYLVPQLDAYLSNGMFNVVEFKKYMGECMDRLYMAVERSAYKADAKSYTQPDTNGAVEQSASTERKGWRKAEKKKKVKEKSVRTGKAAFGTHDNNLNIKVPRGESNSL